MDRSDMKDHYAAQGKRHEEEAAERLYPCPACVGTMPPGTNRMSLKLMLEKGSGKMYWPYSGAVNMMGPIPEGSWYDCHRCSGTGMVAERRRGPEDRRGQK